MSRPRPHTHIRSVSRERHRRKRPGAYLRRMKVSDVMADDPVVASPDMTLLQVVNEVFLRHWISFLPVVENGILLGTIDGPIVTEIDREYWHSTHVNDIFIVPDAHQILTANTPVTTVLRLIDRTGHRKFLVTEDRQLLGVLTLADLNQRQVRARLNKRPTQFL